MLLQKPEFQCNRRKRDVLECCSRPQLKEWSIRFNLVTAPSFVAILYVGNVQLWTFSNAVRYLACIVISCNVSSINTNTSFGCTVIMQKYVTWYWLSGISPIIMSQGTNDGPVILMTDPCPLLLLTCRYLTRVLFLWYVTRLCHRPHCSHTKSFLGQRDFFLNFLPFYLDPKRTKRSVRYYHYSLRNNELERSSQEIRKQFSYCMRCTYIAECIQVRT
jgi:hypothetical protein